MNKELISDLTIANASAAAAVLRGLAGKAKNAVVDLSGVEKIDLSGIQLLISAQNGGNKAKKTLYYTGTVSRTVSDKLMKSGFVLYPSEENEELFTIRRNSGEF